jgi:tetratricopeptide (TPR) repeat protein
MQQAVVLIALHDPLSATELLDLVQVPKYRRGEIRFSDLRIRVAAEGGDWAGALSELERSNAQYPRETLLGRRSRDPVFFAELYAHAGRYTEADEVLASNPSDNYEGWRARGRVATLRQDYSNAEQAFTQAVRLAPSFAPAYKDWGDLLRAKGDLTGAIAKYSDANRRGPHWADPSKSWGDVLLMQGKLHEALVKYDAALKYAPNWAALKAAREAAAKRSS